MQSIKHCTFETLYLPMNFFCQWPTMNMVASNHWTPLFFVWFVVNCLKYLMSKLILRTMYSTLSTTLGTSLGVLSLNPSRQAFWSARQRREDILKFNRFFWLAIPFLTEVEYQNKFLHFHWLLGMSGSLMGSWRKLQFFWGMFRRNTSENSLPRKRS